MEPTVEQVTGLALEFEALTHGDRTSIQWERVEFAAVELVRVELRGADELDEVIEVEHELWAQFLDLVLNEVLPERSAPAEMPDDTQPEMKTLGAMADIPDVGQHKPDAPTSPSRATGESFLRCSVSMTLATGRRSHVIEGPGVMRLYSRVYGFARETGLALPG